MKKLFIAVLLAVTVAASAFAADTKKVSLVVQENFNAEFKKAADVSWTTVGDFAKATFLLNGEKIEAFYSVDGEKIGTSESISLDELPVKAKRSFAKKFADYDVKQAILFEGTEESAYFISAENEKESVIIKVYDNGQTSIYKKTKK